MDERKESFNIQQMLYQKYSSSQTYFYTNTINDIVKEKRTCVNIFYEDVEYLLDLEENMKRWYHSRQFDNKMFTFKEYYFYHQDCPRIFLKGVQQPYVKWQDKKRDLVYKKLKLIYNESYESSADSRQDEQKSKNFINISHFLLEISDYNPYSKKYYLRVEARKEKEKKKQDDQKQHQSKRDIQYLNHELSCMLNDISQLSQISTLSIDSPKHFQKYKNQKIIMKAVNKSEQKSRNNSHLNSSNSIIKFSFKKQKESTSKLASLKETKKITLSKQKETLPDPQRMSPKYDSNQPDARLIKSKSIFSVSSYGPLNKQTELRILNSKRDQLKLNFDSRKLILDPNNKKYETEKKKEPRNIVIKTKSISKFEPRQSLQTIKMKQASTGKSRNDEFSDKKLAEIKSQMRMRSLKSDIITNNKKWLSVKPSLQLQKGKRILELKNW